MVTPELSPTKPRRSRKLFRILLSFAATGLALILVLATWFYVVARLALPQIDGKITVNGLSAPVNVERDKQGLPAINASTLEDLFFAQGYVTAQDRLWQMDMTRRYASGRLSEVLGSKMLESDVRQRTLLIPMIAEHSAAALPTRDRAYLEAYARGVNAYIDSHKNRLPAEFRVLHYTPQPWTVVDSLLVGISMSEMLNLETLQTALDREAITGKVGPELAADLYPNSSFRDHPPVPGPEKSEDSIDPSQDKKMGAQERNLHTTRIHFPANPDVDSFELLRAGSNNWAISGAHTVSGKPLLSNDMHLPLQIPNTWYEIHLTCGDFDVEGVSLPGVPFVIAGHNQRIAWGFTNIGPAVTEFYIEDVNNAGQYMTPEGWKSLEHRHESVNVRWGKGVDLDIAITRHGPIVNDIIPGEKRTLALKWVLFDPAASQVPFFDIDSARNWDEFRRAFSHFGSPGQNVVYADVDGHIGYQVTGYVPIRPWIQKDSGFEPYAGFPVSGTDNSHEWAGYIPFDKLPSVLDPPSGIIATANGRITPDEYPYLISTEWGPAYRTERIYRVLSSGKKFSVPDMLELQTDVFSDFDRFCAQRFVYAIDHAQKASERTRQAAEIMRGWDGKLTVDTPAANIVVASRRQLVKMLLKPKLGDSYADYHWFMASVWLENLMLMKPAQWLPSGYSDFDSLFADAVEKAVNSSNAPRTLADWRWGKTSIVNLQHPVFGAVPILRSWTGPGSYPQSGNGNTVKQAGKSFGPSERMTVDFANLDNSTLNIVTGESGNVFSPNYLDQWNAWYRGTTFLMPFSKASVQNSAVYRLVLEPQR